MSNYRVLLLGIGFFGEQWLDVIGRNPDCTVAGAAGKKSEFEAIEKKKGVKFDFPTFENYKEAIDTIDADIMVCVLPTVLHSDAAKRALNKGMHVLSEKPLSFSVEDAIGLVEYKRKFAEKQYIVDQNYRWRPYTRTIKRLMDEGFLGAVNRINLHFNRPEMLVGYRGGLEMPFLQDVSIHHFDLLRYFTSSDCERIYCVSYRDPWSEYSGKASTEAIITMSNGVTVNYTGTWSGRGPETPWDGVFNIMGEKGCLFLNEKSEVVFYDAASQTTRLVPNDDIQLTEMDHCLDICVRAIRGTAKPETDIEDNVKSFLMVCAAEKSVRESRPVDMKEILS